MRILYVEDNPANLSLVERVARIGKHDVVTYMNGTTALENFERDQPDIVLMDIQLPGSLTGLDVVRRLRADGHKLPIIAVTAYAMVGDRERCLAAGCDEYIAKPLPIADLVTLFERFSSRIPSPAAAETVTAKPKTSDAPEPAGVPGQMSPLFIPKASDSDRLASASPALNVPLPKTEHSASPEEKPPVLTNTPLAEAKTEEGSASAPDAVSPSADKQD